MGTSSTITLHYLALLSSILGAYHVPICVQISGWNQYTIAIEIAQFELDHHLLVCLDTRQMLFCYV